MNAGSSASVRQRDASFTDTIAAGARYSGAPQRRVKVTVKNPWLKKNPLLSLWLSGANSVAGSMRSRATSEAHRQTARMIADGQRQMLAFWTGGNVGVKKKRRKSR